jgi:hypothetical protein
VDYTTIIAWYRMLHEYLRITEVSPGKKTTEGLVNVPSARFSLSEEEIIHVIMKGATTNENDYVLPSPPSR